MGKILTYSDSSEYLAKNLLHYMQEDVPNATCRPWNRFEANETEWLISPVREWPLYRPSKYFATRVKPCDAHDDPAFATGLYVEKGFSGDACTVKQANECMTANWGWHAVIAGLRSGELADVLQDLGAPCRHNTTIVISGGYEGPAYGEYRITIRSDCLQVTVVTPSDPLAPLARVHSWRELAQALDTMTDDGWLWVDLYIQLRLEEAAHTCVKNAWGDNQVWSDFLKPLFPWISEK